MRKPEPTVTTEKTTNESKQSKTNKQTKKKTIKVTDKSVAIAWTVLSVLNGQRQI